MRRRIVFLLSILLCLLAFAISVSATEAVDVGKAGERLDANTQKIYLFLKEEIVAVANGSKHTTVFEIDGDTLISWGIRNEWTRDDLGADKIGDAAQVEAAFMAQFPSMDGLMDALLHDCPYELYWYDKTVGYRKSSPISQSGIDTDGQGGIDEVESAKITGLQFEFFVSADYQLGAYQPLSTTVDTAKTAATANAIARADAIVLEYAAFSDYEKLIAYRNWICDLVTYHSEAASSSYTGGYGDPWQIVYVFDADAATNVVCEGYAKAFQYLCDRSDFAADVVCYTVSGTMSGGTGAGGHMWNVVAMGDGAYYMVDVTNSDEGSIGQDGGLFLSGYEGTRTNGYLFEVGNSEISFVYDSNTLSLWGVESSSILRLADQDYTPPAIEIVIPAEQIVYNGEALTVGATNASDIVYRGSQFATADFDWTYTWYEGTQPLTEAPKDAGIYRLEVRAVNRTDPNDVYQASKSITIAQAMPTYTPPEELSATFGDTLGDIVLPNGFSWQDNANTSVGNAGIHSFSVIYTPSDTKNYETVQDIAATVVVKKATPTYTAPNSLQASYGDLLSDVKLPEGFSWQIDLAQTRLTTLGTVSMLVTYTPTDLQNYHTVSDIGVEIEVSRRDISDAVIELGDAVFYSGKLLTQTVKSVKINGMDVTTYEISGNTATDVGSYMLTVTGTGNYEGTATVMWTVSPMESVDDSGEDPEANAPTEEPFDPTFMVVIGAAGAGLILILVVVIVVVSKKK